MTRKIFLITFFVVLFFVCESVLIQQFGPWARPNLQLLLVIFFNLCFGIRYSLLAAFLAGFLRDSFATGEFGTHIFSLVLCAFMTTMIKRNLFHSGSGAVRVMIVLVMTVFYFVVNYVLMILKVDVDFPQAAGHILLPDAVLTVLVTPWIFGELRKCVSKSSV